jgi:hypothetical protein
MSGVKMKINGLSVVDATKSITIKVTASDILKSTKKDQTECAAAIACKRQLKATEVRVHVGRTYIRYNGQWKRYITSSALRDEVVAFDRGGDFNPGEYTLVSMQPSRRNDRKYRLNKKKNKVKRISRYVAKRLMIANVRPIGIYA